MSVETGKFIVSKTKNNKQCPVNLNMKIYFRNV